MLWEQGTPYSLFSPAWSLPHMSKSFTYNEFLHLRAISHGYVPILTAEERAALKDADRAKTGEAQAQARAKVPTPSYNIYASDVEAFFAKEPSRVRAAMQYGGIIWRLARHYARDYDVDEYLAGPDYHSCLYGGCPRFVDVGGQQQGYWEDVLTEDELTFICGLYIDDTDSKYTLCVPDWL